MTELDKQLIEAAKIGDVALCKLLLAVGADPSVKTVIHWTDDYVQVCNALEIAISQKHTHCIELLSQAVINNLKE